MQRFFTRLFLLAALVGLAIPAALLADPIGPRKGDRQITLVVRKLLEKNHISKETINDRISQRTFESFVKGFDPLKLYFTQADVDSFAKRRNELDDELAKYRVNFAYQVYERFAERVGERVKLAIELLGEEHDFTKDETFHTDGEAVEFAASDEEIRDRWRRRVKYDLLQLKVDKVKPEESTKRLKRRYSTFLKQTRRMSDDELLERYLTSVTTSFDPHTTYFSPSTLNDFRIRLGLNYQGIGAELEPKDGNAIIRKIMDGGGAKKQGGLKAGDRIVKVGQGREGELVDVVEMKLSEIINLIRGKEGTVVRIGVIHEGETETKVYSIVREKITLSDSAAKGTVIELGKKEGGSPVRIGVIKLASFYMDMEAARRSEDYKSTTRDVLKILDDFKTKKVDVVLLDLRNNGGGSLPEAIRLTGLFINTGPVVQVKDSGGDVEHYDDLDKGMAWNGPLVVAVNKFSASASEILAGAIQDYGRGVIVGDPSTHGKGTVQSLLELGPRLFHVESPPNLGALKITIQQFYRPNGESTQKRGVAADVVLPSLTASLSDGESELDYALSFDKVKAVGHVDYKMINDSLKVNLDKASKDRRGDSDDFQQLTDAIREYKEQKERKAVPLQEAKFVELQKNLKSQRDQLTKLREQTAKQKDFFLNELAMIASDYFNALKGKVATSE